MAFLLICFHFVAQVFSETLPALPQDVLFDNWQVTWTSASEESTVSYTVRYSSFDSDLWKDVPTCKQINFTSCKVTSIKAEAEHGCVMLGVQAERRGLTSDLVRACSRQGTPCSPEVRLSARPGFFTVYLSRKNGIALEGDHIKHRIYFGKEGEHLEIYEDAVSSVSINNLKEGERYCAKVQYTYFDHPVGLSSCTQCEVIPQSMASAVLSPPRNVRLTSMNMNLVLRWDSPEGVTGDIFYTTECNTSVRICHVGCVNISTLECDFSSLNTFLSVYGRYKARVRAQRGENHSSWVESKPITLESDTMIGSPNVSLISNGATIGISVKDPTFAISDLRSVYGTATYNITYWKDGQNEKAKHISSALQNQIFLNDLDPGTKYCVQVQISAEGNTKPSNPSSTVCESTTNAEATWVPAVATFLVMTMAITLVVIAVFYRRRISHFLCPKDKLPENLLAASSLPLSWATHNHDQLEEIYNSVNVIAEKRSVEEL
ncbi:interleukin-10 receptor subunit beta isoform X1 [Syngnathus scovelli]|uniref:interleukin-10 receptor subunit beta isoform X1 n=1 Tax=Syngnathus scovelli TaxID=161590 RepID=UPI0035CA2C43